MGVSVGETQFFGKGKEVIEPPTALEIAIKKLQKIDKEYILDRIDVPNMENKIDGAYDKVDTLQHLWETYVIADILGYVFVGIVALFFLMIAYLAKKHDVVKYIFIALAILVGTNGGKVTTKLIDSVARSSKFANLEIQRFDYSDNMVINVDLVNTGKFDYTECSVHFTFYKKTDRLPINIVNKIKPLHEQTVELKDIKRRSYKHIRLTIYTISKDLNFTMENTRQCK